MTYSFEATMLLFVVGLTVGGILKPWWNDVFATAHRIYEFLIGKWLGKLLLELIVMVGFVLVLLLVYLPAVIIVFLAWLCRWIRMWFTWLSGWFEKATGFLVWVWPTVAIFMTLLLLGFLLEHVTFESFGNNNLSQLIVPAVFMAIFIAMLLLGIAEGIWALFLLAMLFVATALVLIALGMVVTLSIAMLSAVALAIIAVAVFFLFGSMLGALIALAVAALLILGRCGAPAEVAPVQKPVQVVRGQVSDKVLPLPKPQIVPQVTVVANRGDGCIKMLTRLGMTDAMLGKSKLRWCQDQVKLLGRKAYWHSNPGLSEIPRVCMNVVPGKKYRPESWTAFYLSDGSVQILVPEDSPFCTPKK